MKTDRKLSTRGTDPELRSDKQVAFAREYCKDWNGAAAAIRAGYSANTAAEQASRLLTIVNIKKLIEAQMHRLADAAEVDGALVLSELYMVSTADPRELVSVEVWCCRYCWGMNGLRMWTPAEYTDAIAAAKRDGLPPPEIAGGFPYDPRREPNPACNECFGRGVEHVTVTPSKKLSRAASRLLSSIRQTKDGIEIKMHDKMAATLALAKITGVLRDRTELTGPGGGPLQLQPVPPPRDPRTLTDDELREALRAAGHPLLLEGGSK